jgi:hypothetical protein
MCTCARQTGSMNSRKRSGGIWSAADAAAVVATAIFVGIVLALVRADKVPIPGGGGGGFDLTARVAGRGLTA